MPSITGLASNLELTAVENKIPDISSLMKSTDYDTKVSDIEKKVTDHNHEKYISTEEFNKLTTKTFNARLPQANLVANPDFDGKLQSLSKGITSKKTEHILVENELKQLKAKINLKNMVLKIIYYFSQFADILKRLQMLVVVIIYISGNLKACLMKGLILLLHLIIVLLQN